MKRKVQSFNVSKIVQKTQLDMLVDILVKTPILTHFRHMSLDRGIRILPSL